MDYQERLTTDYRKNIGSLLFRLIVILATVFSETLLGGGLKKPTIFDGLRQILGTRLVVSQLELTTPEISSINEEIRLIAKDKAFSVCYLLFNILKFGISIYSISAASENSDGLLKIPETPLKMRMILADKAIKGDSYSGILDTFDRFNSDIRLKYFFVDLWMIFVGILCVYSSQTYKFVIKIASKKTILGINTWAIFFLKTLMVCMTLKICFISLDPEISFIFLVVLVYHVLRLMKKASSSTTKKIKLTAFAVTIKWTCLVIIVLIELIKSFEVTDELPNIMRAGNPTISDRIAHLISKFNNSSINKRDNIGGIKLMIFFVLLFLYLKDIKHGARLDFFDIHLAENMSKLYLYQSQWKEGQDIPSSSLFAKFFTRKLVRIFPIEDSKLFNGFAKFKPQFLRMFYQESRVMEGILEVIRKNHIYQMSSHKRLKVRLHRFYRWIKNAVIYFISVYFVKILLLMINFYSCMYFLFYTEETQYLCFLNFTLLYWNLCSMVVKDPQIMKNLTFILVFPAYILDMMQIYFIVYQKKFFGNGDNEGSKSPEKSEVYIQRAMHPHTPTSHCIIFISTTIYTFAILLRLKSERYNIKIKKQLINRLERVRKDSKFTKIFLRIYSYVSSKILKVFRYFPIIAAIIVALHSVNILNTILFIMALLFLWNPDYDRKYWIYFLMFIFFDIIIKQVSNYAFPIEKFNVEFIAMIGITTIEEKASKKDWSPQLTWLFSLCFLASLRYRFLLNDPLKNLNQKSDDKEVHLKSSRIIRKFQKSIQFLQDVYQYYMIWVYHVFFNLILIHDQKDALSTLLFIIESITLIIHISIWKRGRKHDYRTLYKTWYLTFLVVIAYALIRYLLFFFKYSTVNFYLNDEDPNKQNKFARIFKLLVGRELLKREAKVTGKDFVIKHYICPLLLLTLGVFTRSAFYKNLRMISSSSKFSNDLIEKKTKKLEADLKMNAIEEVDFEESIESEKQEMPAMSEKEVFSEESSVSSIEDDSKDSKDSKDSEEASSPRRVIKDFRRQSISYISKLTAFSLLKHRNMIKQLKRKPTVFVGLYLFYKGFYISRSITVFLDNINLFTVFMVTVCLINIVYLFAELLKIANEMKINQILELKMKYFYLNFLAGQKFKKDSFYEQYSEKDKRNEIAQLKQYYRQFLLKMEVTLFKINRIFWGVCFFPFVTFSACLWGYTFFIEIRDHGKANHKDSPILLIITGIQFAAKDHPSQVKKELLGIQYMIIGLLFEYVFTSFYLECGEKYRKLDQKGVDLLLKVNIQRYKLLLLSFKKNVSKEKTKSIVDEYDKLQEAYEDMISLDKKRPRKRLTNLALDLKTDLIETENQTKSFMGSSDEDADSEEILGDKNRLNTRKKKKDDKLKNLLEDDDKDNGFLGNLLSMTPFGLFFSKTEGKEDMVRVYMCELTTKEEMLLYLNYNKYKYFYLRFLRGLMYLVPRIAYFPILYGMTEQINIISFACLIILALYSLKKKRFFIDDLKFISWCITIILILHTIHKYLHSVFIDKDISNPKDYADYNAWKKFMVCFGYELKLNQSSAQSGQNHDQALLAKALVTQAWRILNSDPSPAFCRSTLSSFKNYVTPISNAKYQMMFSWYFAFCIGFMILPMVVRYNCINLCLIKRRKDDNFHFYLFDSDRRRNLVIDYKKWKNAPLKMTNFLTKYSYMETLEIHTIVTIIMIFSNRDSLAFNMILIVTLLISIFEHFRKNSRRLRVEKDGRNSKLKINSRNYLYKFMNFYVKSYWLMLLSYHVLQLIYTAISYEFQFMKEFKFHKTSVFLLIFSSIISDFTAIDGFFEQRNNMKREAEIKRAYSSLCEAYQFNERKIYKRIVSMMCKMRLDQMTDQILEIKEDKDILVDFDYMSQDIKRLVIERTYNLRVKYVGLFKAIFLRSLNGLYKMLMLNSDNYGYKDLLFLYNVIKMRNNKIANKSELNLEDYFDHEFEFFQSEIKKIKMQYDLLREGDARKVSEYETSVQGFLDKEIDEEALKIKMEELSDDVINLDYSKMRKYIDIQHMDKSQFLVEDNEDLEDKLTEDLGAAAEILLDSIMKDKNIYQRTSVSSFKSEFKKKGFVKCKYGKLKVILYNISNDQLFKTKGFNVINWKIIILYTLRVLKANLEFIYSLAIILIQVKYGGLINLIVIGFIVFAILIEQERGRTFWWKTLYITYLIITLIRRFLMQNREGNDDYNKKKVEFFLGSNDNNYMLIIPIIMIMFLIENLKKKGFSAKGISDFENPGAAIARLILNDDMETLLDRVCENEEKHSEQNTTHLISLTEDTMNQESYANLKLDVTKWLINNYTVIGKFKMKASVATKKLVKLMRNEIFRIKSIDLGSFLYRNFSYRVSPSFYSTR